MSIPARVLSLAVLAFSVAACAAPATGPTSGTTSAPATAAQVSASPSAEPAADAPPEPVPFTPGVGTFKISIRILEKECFGSAGCNITYRIKPTYSGPALPDDQQLTVTYEVRGGEDQQINSFEMVGTQAEFDAEESISTKSSSAKLRAVVTDVF
ncbi:hypothetical protein [Nonomuraea indica]|uniref:Lipoprotein n=1 Tax=Nonomuraea indica TaxID=1581193 RepID=A0ABW8A6H0_9ACTN